MTVQDDVAPQDGPHKGAGQAETPASAAVVGIGAHAPEAVAEELAHRSWGAVGVIGAGIVSQTIARRRAEVEGDRDLEPKVPAGEQEEAGQAEDIEAAVVHDEHLPPGGVRLASRAQVGVQPQHGPGYGQHDQPHHASKGHPIAHLQQRRSQEVPQSLEAVLPPRNEGHQLEEAGVLAIGSH